MAAWIVVLGIGGLLLYLATDAWPRLVMIVRLLLLTLIFVAIFNWLSDHVIILDAGDMCDRQLSQRSC